MKFARVFALAIVFVMLVGFLPQWNNGLLGVIFAPSAVGTSTSSPLTPNDPINASTYGVGLSGAPVILDEPTLSSMTGGPTTVQAFKAIIQEYLVPMGVKLVFVDPGWDNSVNTSTTFVAGGYEQWLANWLQATYAYGIDNIFFTKQFGYYFASPSWDVDLLNAYPSTVTANASGINNPLSPTTRVVTGTGSQNQVWSKCTRGGFDKWILCW